MVSLNKGMIGLIESNITITGKKVITIPVEKDGVSTGIAVYCVMIDTVNPAEDMKVLAEVVEKITL